MNVRVNFLFRTYRIQPVIYHWRAGVDCLGDYMYGWLKKSSEAKRKGLPTTEHVYSPEQ